VQLLAPASSRDDQASRFENLQVFHDAEARHRQAPLERSERLPVLLVQFVQQASPRRIGQGFEHIAHAWYYM